jgi:L-aspartate oxidase
MSADAGVIRTAAGLSRMAGSLHRLSAQRSSEPNTESWEATNLVTVASALVAAASRRTETRGSHWREDYPAADDAWLGHLELRLGRDGTIATEYVPIKS